jgi:DNA-binding Lrp family transcriptional regulator
MIRTPPPLDTIDHALLAAVLSGELPKVIARRLDLSRWALYRRLGKLERRGLLFRPSREVWTATPRRTATPQHG